MSISRPSTTVSDSGCTVSAVRHSGISMPGEGSSGISTASSLAAGTGQHAAAAAHAYGQGLRNANMPKPTRGREKGRVAKSRQMPRQRSPSRLSCRLAANQQTLGGLPTAAI